MAGGPSDGPASTYPTLRTPASICFTVANADGEVPVAVACARAGLRNTRGAAATPKAAACINSRRSRLFLLGMFIPPLTVKLIAPCDRTIGPVETEANAVYAVFSRPISPGV